MQPLTVLIVEDDDDLRALLVAYTRRAGHRAVQAVGPEEAVAAVAANPAIALVLSDVRMPAKEDGLAFIRAMSRRWPDLPLVALAGEPDDLSALEGLPERPVRTLPKPVLEGQFRALFDQLSRPRC